MPRRYTSSRDAMHARIGRGCRMNRRVRRHHCAPWIMLAQNLETGGTSPTRQTLVGARSTRPRTRNPRRGSRRGGGSILRDDLIAPPRPLAPRHTGHPRAAGEHPRRDGVKRPRTSSRRRRPRLLQGQAHRLPRRQARHRVPERERPVSTPRHRQRPPPAQRGHTPGRPRSTGGVHAGTDEPRRDAHLRQQRAHGYNRHRCGRRLSQGYRLRGHGRGAGRGDATEPGTERLGRHGRPPIPRHGARRQRQISARARL